MCFTKRSGPGLGSIGLSIYSSVGSSWLLECARRQTSQADSTDHGLGHKTLRQTSEACMQTESHIFTQKSHQLAFKHHTDTVCWCHGRKSFSVTQRFGCTCGA